MRHNVATIGRYVLGEALGAGGFAIVYRAHDPMLDRDVALKVLHPHLARDGELRARFLREGRALARVRHPNVVQVYDAGEDGAFVYLAMELVEGEPLFVPPGGVPAEDFAGVVAVAEQLTDALAAIHARGLIHRDVKPANVRVESGTGRAVLLDFGVARTVDAGQRATTEFVIGTPGFMAPEQIEPGRVATAQTDIYQLGALVYALLTGQPPYAGDPAQALYAVVHQPPPNPRAVRPELPPALAAAVTWALAKQPAARPPDPRAFAERLRAALDATPIASRPLFAPETMPATLADAATIRDRRPSRRLMGRLAARANALSGGGIPRPRGVHARPRPLIALGAGLALLVVLGGSALLGRGNGERPELARAVTTTPATAFPALPSTPSPTSPPTLPPAPTPSPQPNPSVSVVPTLGPAPTVRAPSPAPTRTPTRNAPTPTPSRLQAVEVSARLHAEMNERDYRPEGEIVRVPTGFDGMALYVQKGVCRGGDGRCQLLFIFAGERFLGTIPNQPVTGIEEIRPGFLNSFSVTYRGCSPADGPRCAGRNQTTVTYLWDGTKLIAFGTAPGQ